MAVVRDNTQATTANAVVVDDEGNRATAATVSCHIRPNKGMSFSIDILDSTLASANIAEVTEMVKTYLQEEIAKASALGIPVTL